MKKPSSFKVHMEIEIEASNKGNGETPVITPPQVFDLVKYIFTNLQYKGVRVSYRLTMIPIAKGKTILEEKGGTL